MNAFWDRLGISASILCVVHCLLTPVALVFLPLVGASLVHGWIHSAIIAVVVPVALYALWIGYRIHRHTSVIWLAVFGFGAIALAMTFGEDHNLIEAGFMIAAGILLSTAHYKNLRATRTCGAVKPGQAAAVKA
jgi:hypothetical protein